MWSLRNRVAEAHHSRGANSAIRLLNGHIRVCVPDRLLDQVLAAASLDRGDGHLVRRSLVDAALAEEAGHAARLAHPDHPITIEAAGPLLVRADPMAISSILGNLLDNAAAYSPQGSGIWLSASRDGVFAVLAVQDQGPGIPLADHDRIFQRYVRLGTPIARPSAGGLWARAVHRRAVGPHQPESTAGRGPAGPWGCPVRVGLRLASAAPDVA
jgi:two-component system OmpR family sensor kinase